MELDSIAKLTRAFYRITGAESDDDALTEQGDAADDVAYLYLTRGIRAAQRFLIGVGLSHRWRKRSAAITWSGTDAADGGRYYDLPADFLRLNQNRPGSQVRFSGGLVEADGTAWGLEISADDDEAEGDYYYLKNDQVWIAKTASPPSTLYLDYFYVHPALTSATASFDFPTDAMHLAVYEAADAALGESWFPLGQDSEAKISRGLAKARTEAKLVAKQTRTPRQMSRPTRYGTKW